VIRWPRNGREPDEESHAIGLDNLTVHYRIDWEDFLKWYNDNGWGGDEARRLAWTDLPRKHQRLREFL
jgi:hypothetical protein